MRRRDICADSASGTERSHYLDATGMQRFNQIVQNAVGHILIKDPLVAERLQVQFQTLQLDAFLVGSVRKRQRAKVWLACFRTD